ncbi:MAG: glutathione S-transferase family protein [Deltaproteobacteria bacterium]|nr:glutathione S-transferase family protein [Deltaproteobacteria bacterium]
MKIYESHDAPNPRRVRIFLAEKGLQISFEQVDITNAVNRGEEFRRKNSLATVPVLELDNGTCICESVAICRYFEEIHPQPALFGSGPEQRALVEMWNRRIEFNLLQPIADTFRQRHDFFKGRIRQLPEYAQVQRLNAEDALAWLDRELAGRSFVAGDQFSIADITGLVAIDFGRVSKIAINGRVNHVSQPAFSRCAIWRSIECTRRLM